MKWLVFIVAMGLAAPAAAQQTEPDPGIPIEEVTLAPRPEWFPTGKTATYTGEVDAEGVGFHLSGLTMRMPVAITLIGVPKAPISLAIGKSWGAPERTADTTADGVVAERFRTDDDAMIRVRSLGERRHFELIVWVGDERTDYPDERSPLDFDQAARIKAGGSAAPPAGGSATATPPAGSGSAATSAPSAPSAPTPPAQAVPSSGGTSPVVWVIAGALVAIVLLLVVIVLRRKR